MGVTAPTHLVKQPSELRTYAMDFSNLMAAGETISSIASSGSVLRGDGTSDLVLGTTSASGQTVSMDISGGTDREVYRVTIVINTSGGSILEGDANLKISDK